MSFLPITLFALSVLAQSPAPAPTAPDRRVMVDRELRSEEVRLLSLTGEAIVYEDAQGRRRQASVAGIVALLPVAPEWDAPAGSPPGPADTGDRPALETVDGQRFPGERAASSGDGEMIVWAHPVFGRIAVAIDRVASAVLHPAAPGSPIADARDESLDLDRLTLINGDSLEGFVVGLGDPIEIEVDGRVMSVPAERVSAVRLANDAQSMRGLVVWLDDGTVVVVARVEDRADQGLSISLPGGQSGVYPAGAVRAVAFEAGRLVGLASLEPTEQSPVGERRVGEPLRIVREPLYGSSSELGAPNIVIPGPMRARWTLPAAAVRFAALAEAPFDAAPWGDCEVVVRIDGVERIRRRLNQDHPRLEINLPLDPTGAEHTLEIIVEPGAYGPIHDRVILRRPLILLEESSG